MKILSIEYINHVKLGTFKLDNVDGSTVTISGYNGSGKSFLLNSMHPYSGTHRYHKAYDIVEGQSGLKRIKFLLDNGHIMECIHEYTPTKKSHSCKSYLNVHNGIHTKELNPTGHNDLFKEQVMKYLKFDNNVQRTAFISYQNNGIASSSGVERKKILETTNKSDMLDKMRKNADKLNRDNQGYFKRMNEEHINFIRDNDIDELSVKIEEIETAIPQLEKEIEDLTTNKVEIMTNLKQLEDNINGINIPPEDVVKAMSILENINESTNNKKIDTMTLQKLKDLYTSTNNKILVMESELNKIEYSTREVENKIRSKKKVEEVTSRLRSMESSLDEEIEKILQYYNDYTIADIESTLWRLNSLYNIIDVVSEVNTPYASMEAIKQQIRESKEKMDQYVKFIYKYDLAASNTDGKDYDFQYVPKLCDACELYNKFVKSKQFVETNYNDYTKFIEYKREEEENISKYSSIVRIEESFDDSAEKLKDILSDKYIKLLGLDSIDSFIVVSTKRTNRPVLTDLISFTKEWLNKYKTLLKNKEECVSILNTIDDKESSESDALKETLCLLLEKLKESQAELSKLMSIRDICVANKVEELDTIEMFTSISNLTQSEFKIFYNSIKPEALKEARNELNEVNTKLASLNTKLSELHMKSIEYKHTQKRYSSISNELIKFTERKDIILQAKNILDKNIPIALLKDNLKFIEDNVNAILEDVDTTYRISVEVSEDETEITIPVITKNGVVSDVSLLSDGERCLVGLPLCAAIVHLQQYSIMCWDEVDANLDTINRGKFNNIIYSIQRRFGIDQIICVSHHVTTTISDAIKVLIGSGEGLEVDVTNAIRI